MAHSLASLTATYTDSEGEDEDPGHEAGTVTLTEESSLSKPPTPLGPTTKRKRAHVNRLVSYQDENYISTEGDDSETEEEELGGVEDADKVEAEDKDGESSPSKTESRRPVPTDIELPPEAKGRCPVEHQEKVNKHYEKVRKGVDMNTVIQRRKDFRNPSIYEKLILFCNIDELGTNYPPAVFNPDRWDKNSFYEELAKVQKLEMDKKEKEKKDKAKVEIVTGTARKPPTLVVPQTGSQKIASAALAAAAATAASIEEKRKSKWDQVGSVSALTANVTGTKSTVISAFGSLPKRPKM